MMVQELEDLASPVGAFVRECCEVGPEHSIPRSDLYAAYSEWAKEDQGRKHVEDEAAFGRNLHAVLPELKTTRPRMGAHRMRCYEGVALREGEP